jgi:excisionase family DNA binding protein
MALLETEVLLTVPEVRQLLRVSDRTVRRWIADKTLPIVKLPGDGIRIRELELLRIIRNF